LVSPPAGDAPGPNRGNKYNCLSLMLSTGRELKSRSSAKTMSKAA